MCQHLGDFLEGLMWLLGELTLVGGQLSLPLLFLGTGGWVSHGLLRPISTHHLIHSPFLHRHVSASASIPRVLPSHQCLAWFALSHLCLTPHSLTLPTQGSSTWLAGWGVASYVVWVLIKCELPVRSTHHASLRITCL